MCITFNAGLHNMQGFQIGEFCRAHIQSCTTKMGCRAPVNLGDPSHVNPSAAVKFRPGCNIQQPALTARNDLWRPFQHGHLFTVEVPEAKAAPPKAEKHLIAAGEELHRPWPVQPRQERFSRVEIIRRGSCCHQGCKSCAEHDAIFGHEILHFLVSDGPTLVLILGCITHACVIWPRHVDFLLIAAYWLTISGSVMLPVLAVVKDRHPPARCARGCKLV